MSVPPRIAQYRIVREVGRGGMGVVYEAFHETLGRRVALKLLPSRGDPDGSARERLGREARAAARLSHHGIVQVHELGEADGCPFIAMEFVEGESLTNHIQRLWHGAEATAGNLVPTFHIDIDGLDGDPNDVAEPTSASTTTTATLAPRALTALSTLVAKAAHALHAAHEADVLHRDVKPGNLLVTPAGDVKVVDFGLARMQETDRLTRTGDLLGTPTYLSPEQIRGEQADRRSDVYSLGVTLYEAVCGHVPFEAESVQSLMHRILNREPLPPRKHNHRIPRDLETIALKAIEKEPGRRYQTARALAEDLERWIRGEPILARPSGPVTRVVKLIQRRRGLALAAAVTLIALASTAVVLLQKREVELEADAKDHALRRERALAAVADGISNSIQGNSRAAVLFYDAALAADPFTVQALTFRGTESLMGEDLSGARSDFERARAIDPNYVPLQMAWAILRGRLREDGEDGADAAAAFPATPPAESIVDTLELDALGLIQRSRGLYLEAHDCFSRARERDRARVTSIVGVGFSAFHLGRYDEALEAFQLLQGLLPRDNPLPAIVRIACLFQQGKTLDLEGRRAIVKDARRLAAQLEPLMATNPFAALACTSLDALLPEGLDEGGHSPGACLIEAERRIPKGAALPALFHEMAASLFVDVDPGIARRHAERAMELRPRSERGYLVLGQLAARAGDPVGARRWLLEAHQRAPEAFEPLAEIIRLPPGEGNLPDPRFARTLARILPDDLAICEAAARILEGAGEGPAAAELLRHGAQRLRQADRPREADILDDRAARLARK
jgi:serine/threonine protein kinase